MEHIVVRVRAARIAFVTLFARRWAAVLAMGFGLLGMATVAFGAGWLVRGSQPPVPQEAVPKDIAELWQRQFQEQRGQLAALQTQAESSSRETARRVELLQAHVTRLDAAADRMTRIAGVDPSEFNFPAEPAVGGPEPADAVAAPEGDPVLAALDDFQERLDHREREMQVLDDLLKTRRLLKAKKPVGWPVKVGYVSSAYGWRADPFNGKRDLHAGMDFAGASGSDVLAVAAGTVAKAERLAGYGLIVEINHGNGYVTRYGHNETVLVNVGDKVRAGQKIAAMGNSGRSTGPHVHFELLLNGLNVDPALYIAAGQ